MTLTQTTGITQTHSAIHGERLLLTSVIPPQVSQGRICITCPIS